MRRDTEIDPERLLLSPQEATIALGSGVFLEPGKGLVSIQQIGNVLGTAAISSAFRSFTGGVLESEDTVPLQVGQMALVFADELVAARTFDRVAQAAHLRTKLGATDVSVETVTASSGLVSYWCYLSLGPVLVIATLDTLDPVRVSMTEFRSLVTHLSDHLERSLPT